MTARSWPYPSGSELVAAVREWLAEPGDGAEFHRRVAVNSLAIVERELEAAPGILAAEVARAEQLGASGPVELAALIRSGHLDDRFDEVVAALRAGVRSRIDVDRPGYADRG